MDRQYDNLLILAKNALYQTHKELQDPDWDQILTLSQEQAISGFIAKCAISGGATNIAVWEKTHYSQISSYLNIAAAQNNLHRIMCDAGIKYVVLKGFSLASYYPPYSMRTMGDIDFIVRPDDFRKTFEVLLNSGFVCRDADLDRALEKYDIHVALYYQNIRYELHRVFVGKGGLYLPKNNDYNANQLVDEFNELIYDSIESACIEHINGITPCGIGEDYQFFRPLDMVNGLILLQHISKHIRTGLGLRQIIDWSMFVAANYNAPWFDDFEQLAGHFHLRSLSDYMTAICHNYLGLNAKASPDIDPIICSSIMTKILNDGNFGRSNIAFSSTVVRFFYGSKQSGILKRLQIGGLHRWSAAEKYTVLRPFAWLYQLGRLLPQIIRHPKDFKNGIRTIIKNQKLFAKIGSIR